jgi:hypothetical protein
MISTGTIYTHVNRQCITQISALYISTFHEGKLSMQYRPKIMMPSIIASNTNFTKLHYFA